MNEGRLPAARPDDAWTTPRTASGPIAASVSSSLAGLHVVVRPPLAPGTRDGRISCRPAGMMEPIVFEWSVPSERPTFDESGSEAWDVAPGAYRVRATDGVGVRAEVSVDAAPLLPGAVVVDEYRVTSASTDRARDGSVEALGSGLGDGMRFLWTGGVVTDGPVLRDVPCGLYAATALPRVDGPAVVVVHRCAPARVSVGREW